MTLLLLIFNFNTLSPDPFRPPFELLPTLLFPSLSMLVFRFVATLK